MRVRLSIRSIMGVIVVVAVGVAALRYADELAESLTFSATLLVLGVAALGGTFAGGRRRAFCAGAALFGWGYLFLAAGPWAAEAIGPQLATTRLLRYAGPRIDRRPPPATAVWSFTTTTPPGTAWTSTAASLNTFVAGDVTLSNPPGQVLTATVTGVATATESFLKVGHSLFALLLALVGGWIARRFRAGEESRAAGPVVP